MSTLERLGPAELRRLHVHRYAALFRVLAGDERDRLRDSLRARGFDPLYPIVISPDRQIVDGRNRRDLCADLEIDALVVVREFADDAEVARFIIGANLARRHLDARERRELAGRLVVNGTSTREAAKAAGVSEATARRAAGEARAGATHDAPAAERVVGADGKRYPATRQHVARGPNRAILLERIGMKAMTPSIALTNFVGRDLGSNPLSAPTRARAAQAADQCRAMAATFDAIASGKTADDLVKPHQPTPKRSRNASTKVMSTIGSTSAA
jgi:ParB-like chromosome segregation protein Spo0J